MSEKTVTIEQAFEITVNLMRGYQQENQKLRELFEAYCVCSSMGATGGQCCFCEDLEKITKGVGKTI